MGAANSKSLDSFFEWEELCASVGQMRVLGMPFKESLPKQQWLGNECFSAAAVTMVPGAKKLVECTNWCNNPGSKIGSAPDCGHPNGYVHAMTAQELRELELEVSELMKRFFANNNLGGIPGLIEVIMRRFHSPGIGALAMRMKGMVAPPGTDALHIERQIEGQIGDGMNKNRRIQTRGDIHDKPGLGIGVPGVAGMLLKVMGVDESIGRITVDNWDELCNFIATYKDDGGSDELQHVVNDCKEVKKFTIGEEDGDFKKFSAELRAFVDEHEWARDSAEKKKHEIMLEECDCQCAPVPVKRRRLKSVTAPTHFRSE